MLQDWGRSHPPPKKNQKKTKPLCSSRAGTTCFILPCLAYLPSHCLCHVTRFTHLVASHSVTRRGAWTLSRDILSLFLAASSRHMCVRAPGCVGAYSSLLWLLGIGRRTWNDIVQERVFAKMVRLWLYVQTLQGVLGKIRFARKWRWWGVFPLKFVHLFLLAKLKMGLGNGKNRMSYVYWERPQHECTCTPLSD